MSVGINNSRIINDTTTSFTGGAPKLITVKSEKIQNTMEKLGGLSTPANRFFLGATALSIQPWFDFYNKDVDEKTRKISTIRTIAKIIVGTATGIVVRSKCIKWMENFTCSPEQIKNMSESQKKWATIMVPAHIPHEKFSNATRLLKKHRQALGSIVALGVMLFTNFIIDAPLTKFLTNMLTEKINHHKKEEKTFVKGGS